MIPGQVSVTASVGPVWATVTARYESTLWEFGNGDSVECDGLGTPIVDLDTWSRGRVVTRTGRRRRRSSRAPTIWPTTPR